jgi:GNAT superfamily N-acetyltransferase
MISAVTLQLARSEQDVQTVAQLWNQSASWLAAHGYDQWQYPIRWDNLRRTIANQTCWLVNHDANAVGTITLEYQPDPYWLPADQPDDGLYVHRMVVAETARGIDLGTALLDWAGRRTTAAGRHWLRLDAWKNNTDLHRYYLERGFTFVRIDDNPDDPSGACFQRPAAVQLGKGPTVITVE